MRYVLDISYEGTQYAGWQFQTNALSVQEVLDDAISVLLKTKLRSTGAGRTDSGVHGRQLIVHFDHEGELPAVFHYALNGILPHDIAVNGVYLPAVQPDKASGVRGFHARFDAISRSYEYHIVLRKSPLARKYAYWLRRPVDFEKMNEAAAILPEYKDFACFCKAHAQSKTTLCDLHHAYWEHTHSGWVFHIKANRFLRGMVRAVVGTLLDVGSGKLDIQGFRDIIESLDRKKAGANAPAHGLFLTEVAYPKGAFTPLV